MAGTLRPPHHPESTALPHADDDEAFRLEFNDWFDRAYADEDWLDRWFAQLMRERDIHAVATEAD